MIENGTHDELLAQGGEYAQMFMDSAVAPHLSVAGASFGPAGHFRVLDVPESGVGLSPIEVSFPLDPLLESLHTRGVPARAVPSGRSLVAQTASALLP